MLPVLGKINLCKVGRGGVLPPPLVKYLERSFQIVTGKASSNHLPTMTDKKTFVHMCSAHFMKAISYKDKTVYRSKERSQFITFCCSF